ncbi:MAG: hypothetical protein ACRC1K_11845, partial [Planctomycetia bacterium]
DHRVHQFDDGGEKQRALMLPPGGAVEQGVEPIGLKEVFDDRPRHDADGTLLDESIESLGQHPCGLEKEVSLNLAK